jgi:hypothetical protein
MTKSGWLMTAVALLVLIALPSAYIINDVPSAPEPQIETKPPTPAPSQNIWCLPEQKDCLFPTPGMKEKPKGIEKKTESYASFKRPTQTRAWKTTPKRVMPGYGLRGSMTAAAPMGPHVMIADRPEFSQAVGKA